MKFIKSYSGVLFLTGFLILVIPEILKVYWIMPLPGSQLKNNVQLAYSINRFIWITRIAGGLTIGISLLEIFRGNRTWKKVTAAFFTLLALCIFYITTQVMLADKMFYQPETKLMLSANKNQISGEHLVIGVELNGEARAYPINIIAYHHQVRDTVGGMPIMVTYCSVCRTGRVYKPEVDGKPETFGLVGMDQWNAMFEDASTKSWWRQETGECCAGQLKGKQLPEIPSEQMAISAWQNLHPQTLIMQPDPKFAAQYQSLNGYDLGGYKGGLTGTDTSSLNRKSWIVGLISSGGEKIYDWNILKKQRIINDTIAGQGIVLVLQDDLQSFHSFYRSTNDSVFQFILVSGKNLMEDKNTHSLWNMKGECIDGSLKGLQLKPVPAYQEFYHSFSTFHPNATVYAF